MTRTIRCETCNAVIGMITKPEVTDADVTLYRQMVRCPNGHIMTVTIDAPEDPPAEPDTP